MGVLQYKKGNKFQNMEKNSQIYQLVFFGFYWQNRNLNIVTFIQNVWITEEIFVIPSLKKFRRMSWPDISWIIIRTLHWRSSDILQHEGNIIKVDIKKAKWLPFYHKETFGDDLDVLRYIFNTKLFSGKTNMSPYLHNSRQIGPPIFFYKSKINDWNK